MFDVGFSEILMVGLVALLVIGPEKLPKAARIAGFWLGKTRSTIAAVKAEIKQELHAEEMRQLLQQDLAETELHELKQVIDETTANFSELNHSLHTTSLDPNQTLPNDKSS